MKHWIITKTVIEKYEVWGATKEEAIENCSKYGDPFSVTIAKETVKLVENTAKLVRKNA